MPKVRTPDGAGNKPRAVGKLALGADGKTTNEAVQQDIGWTLKHGKFTVKHYMKNTSGTLTLTRGRQRYLDTCAEISWSNSDGKELEN